MHIDDASIRADECCAEVRRLMHGLLKLNDRRVCMEPWTEGPARPASQGVTYRTVTRTFTGSPSVTRTRQAQTSESAKV